MCSSDKNKNQWSCLILPKCTYPMIASISLWLCTPLYNVDVKDVEALTYVLNGAIFCLLTQRLVLLYLEDVTQSISSYRALQLRKKPPGETWKCRQKIEKPLSKPPKVERHTCTISSRMMMMAHFSFWEAGFLSQPIFYYYHHHSPSDHVCRNDKRGVLLPSRRSVSLPLSLEEGWLPRSNRPPFISTSSALFFF